MLVKEGLFCFILFTWILLIQGRPQGDSMTKTSEKPESVSTKSINFLILIQLGTQNSLHIKNILTNIVNIKYISNL